MRDCVISSSHFDFYDVINYADIIIIWSTQLSFKRNERGSFLNSTLLLQQFLRGRIFKHHQIIPFCLFHIFIPSLTEPTKIADLVDEVSKCYCVECGKIFFSVK